MSFYYEYFLKVSFLYDFNSSEHMKKINGMRSRLLHEKIGSNSASSFSEMVKKILNTPSYTEKKCCLNVVNGHPIVFLNSNTFHDDFNNLVQAIEDNFPPSSICDQCGKSPKWRRTFQPQIMIEVKFYYSHYALHFLNKCLSFACLDYFLS